MTQHDRHMQERGWALLRAGEHSALAPGSDVVVTDDDGI